MPLVKLKPVTNLRVVRMKLFGPSKKQTTAKDRKKFEGVYVEGRVGNQYVIARVPGV